MVAKAGALSRSVGRTAAFGMGSQSVARITEAGVNLAVNDSMAGDRGGLGKVRAGELRTSSRGEFTVDVL